MNQPSNRIDRQASANHNKNICRLDTGTGIFISRNSFAKPVDQLGRRMTFVFGTVATAAFLPVIIFYNTPANIAYLLVNFGFLYGIPYGVNATYMAESFSTDVRGTAIGGAYNMGHLGVAIAPATIGMIAAGGSFTMAFIVMGAAYFIAGVIPGLFIRERQYDPQQAAVSAEQQKLAELDTHTSDESKAISKPATAK